MSTYTLQAFLNIAQTISMKITDIFIVFIYLYISIKLYYYNLIIMLSNVEGNEKVKS